MRVSYYNYQRLYSFLKEDLDRELEHLYSLDDDNALFDYQYRNEKKVGRILGPGYGIGTNSGTAALQFALQALGVGKGDEVITVPSYVCTLLSISNCGATPVMVDVNPDTVLMDLSAIEKKITSRTKALLPIHLYGQMVDMKALRTIAKDHGLFIVEDAAQAHLAKRDGKRPGSLSDAACYSMFLNKNFGGISNGGMITSKKKSVYQAVEQLRNPLSNSSLLLDSHRTPAYLDWIQLAHLKAKAPYLKKWTERRRQIARLYDEELADLPLSLPVEEKGVYHVYRDFALQTPQRDKLKKHLLRKGVPTVIHYPERFHLSKTYAHLKHKAGDFPASEMVSDQTLSLPINPFLKDDEVMYVISIIKKFFS